MIKQIAWNTFKNTGSIDTFLEITEMRKELNSHDNRIVKVEESAKQAHHRIDELVKRFEDKE